MQDTFARIGAELMEFASEEAEFTASRGVVTEMFPYIFAASRTMSSRAISRWLGETHKIKLSAVTISKALREPKKQWMAFAEILEPFVRIYEEAYGIDPGTFLRDHQLFEHFAEKPASITAGTQDEANIALNEVYRAVMIIRESWYSLPETSRKECIEYLLLDDELAEEKAGEQ